MVIAFDTLMLTPKFRGVGIYEYAKNLFLAFRDLVSKNESVTIRYFVAPGYSEKFLALQPLARFEPIPTSILKHQSLWRFGGCCYAAAKAACDLVFSPAPKVLGFGAPAMAITIHDAMASRLPVGMLGRSTAYRLRAEARLAASSAQKILTDSHYSKNDLIELYGVPPNKIVVVHLGYNKELFNTVPADPTVLHALLERFSVRQPYIIHHGMVQLRKNLTRLIDAYKALPSRSSFDLLLAGSLGLGSREIVKAAECIRGGRVVFTGNLRDEEMAVLVKGATLAVIPSLYEGFCLPLIEAMACGVPTIAARTSCLPEVSGGVLRYFDPLSQEEIAATMSAVLNDGDIQRQLKEGGLKRASEFSWQRCASETLGALVSSRTAESS